MPEENFGKVAIIGPGLIGASLGLVIKQRNMAAEIVGLARRLSTLETARRIGAIDRGTTSLDEALQNAGLVVLATPAAAALKLIAEFKPRLRLLANDSGAKPLITDTASTKAEIVAAAQKHLSGRVDFIAGHPMAGSEQSGPEHARADLFQAATWVLTPGVDTSAEALARLQNLVQSTGASPLILPPDIHDQIVAVVSHLPHLLSVALYELAADNAASRPETWRVAAAGFRDMTRLAAGSPEMWRDICLTNSGHIADALARFRSRLDDIEAWLRTRQPEALEEMLAKVQNQTKQLEE